MKFTALFYLFAYITIFILEICGTDNDQKNTAQSLEFPPHKKKLLEKLAAKLSAEDLKEIKEMYKNEAKYKDEALKANNKLLEANNKVLEAEGKNAYNSFLCAVNVLKTRLQDGGTVLKPIQKISPCKENPKLLEANIIPFEALEAIHQVQKRFSARRMIPFYYYEIFKLLTTRDDDLKEVHTPWVELKQQILRELKIHFKVDGEVGIELIEYFACEIARIRHGLDSFYHTYEKKLDKMKPRMKSFEDVFVESGLKDAWKITDENIKFVKILVKTLTKEDIRAEAYLTSTSTKVEIMLLYAPLTDCWVLNTAFTDLIFTTIPAPVS